ncbi:MAG: beta-mannosidase [Clostridiales bacterium]|nr:beta-mannosidase [Clostridiales bacterium]
MSKIDLNNGWRLLEATLDWGADRLSAVRAEKEGWMDCSLPCDVHEPLQHAGRIRDVTQADYSFEAEWIERRSWWFFKTFTADQALLGSEVIELTLESLDAHADVFLNGDHIGTHVSPFYPFARSIRGRLLAGENELAVRLTTGLEQVSDRDLAEINWAVSHEEGNNRPDRGDRRRGFLRKPAYTTGWDWAPKAPSCGIVKPAYITAYNKTAIRGVRLVTDSIDNGAAKLTLTAEVDQLHVWATRDADVLVKLTYDGEVAAEAALQDVLLTSGLNYIAISLDVPDAKLWWPAGYGEQPLYSVELTVSCEGHVEAYPPFVYGIRQVRLNTDRTGDDTRAFTLLVNGVPVFCKGANWIPADSVYARVTDAKYETLIAEAKAANFNMLRIWGGGIYERDVFYQACDRAGILVWHDFMFGCSTCPDHLDWFVREVEQEMDYQTRRLRNHPCMALWCGNNENHWIFNPDDNPGWGIDLTYEKQYGLKTGNLLAKQAVRCNCPDIPYWNSSPYGGSRPNSSLVGDVHHWHLCMMNPDMAKRIEPFEYDKVDARFVSEYGYPGPCPKESIAEYFDGQPIDRQGRVWDLHNNTFEKKTVAAGIDKHYGLDAAKLSLDDYILYAGLTQSLMLGYSLEAIRFKPFCSGALFWMYNDTWGEVGWTIVDYYLRRKISFWGVRRAFAPVKLTLRREGKRVLLQCCNDTPEAWAFEAGVGYQRFDGAGAPLDTMVFRVPPHSRTVLLDVPLPDGDYHQGTFVVIPRHADIDPAALRVHDLRQLQLPGGKPRVLRQRKEGDDLVVTLVSDVYLHAVHIREAYACTDNYFDLLPGQEKRVTVKGVGDEAPTWFAVR